MLNMTNLQGNAKPHGIISFLLRWHLLRTTYLVKTVDEDVEKGNLCVPFGGNVSVVWPLGKIVWRFLKEIKTNM